MPTAAAKPITAEELFAMGDVGRCELIHGELVKMAPSGFEHGTLAATIAGILRDQVRRHKLGYVTGAETGFLLERNTRPPARPRRGVRPGPRVKGRPPIGYFEGDPDLAVEVVSPGDTWPEVEAKVNGGSATARPRSGWSIPAIGASPSTAATAASRGSRKPTKSGTMCSGTHRAGGAGVRVILRVPHSTARRATSPTPRPAPGLTHWPPQKRSHRSCSARCSGPSGSPRDRS